MLDDWCPAIPGLCLYYPGHRYVPQGSRMSSGRSIAAPALSSAGVATGIILTSARYALSVLGQVVATAVSPFSYQAITPRSGSHRSGHVVEHLQDPRRKAR